MSVRQQVVHIAEVEWDGDDFLSVGGKWSGPLPSLADYESIPLILENAIFGLGWGVLVSHEDHAVLGGSSRFVAAFKQAHPSWHDETNALLAEWSGHPNGDWATTLAAKVVT